jgi:CBS-domain-containing membrane protein
MNRAVRDLMSRDVVTVAPSDTIGHAAQLMHRHGVAALPVCDGARLTGLLTDRDLAVRALWVGKPPYTLVRDVACNGAECCFDDDDVAEIARQMRIAQLKLMPVIDHQHRLVGMLSRRDIAARSEPAGNGSGHSNNTRDARDTADEPASTRSREHRRQHARQPQPKGDTS